MTERKLIYADTVVDGLSELILLSDHEKKLLDRFVEKCLAVDAEPVVRCGKCKWWDPDSEYCQFWHHVSHPGHYCGEGVVKPGRTPAKEIKKNQKVTVVKEVQLSPVIDKHDLETKANIARKFIQKDNKVKVTLRFKGRMIVHQDIGIKVMEEFAELLSDVSSIEANIKLEGKQLFMTLGPKREK